MRRKVLLVTILILSILLQCIMPIVANAETGVVITLNGNLYSAVRKSLEAQGISAQYKDSNHMIVISSDEVAKVTKLDLQNSEIDDLSGGSSNSKGLEGFENLSEINLHANYLTEDSHLDVLSNLKNLTKADLSSNQISDVSSISNFDDKNVTYDITNQTLTGRAIIKVDDSVESEAKDKTKAIVSLPSILLKNEGGFSPSWIWNNNVRLTREIIPIDEKYSPEIDFEDSFQKLSEVDKSEYLDFTNLDNTDDSEKSTTDCPYMIINVARGEGDSYHTLNGLIKFKIEVLDSNSNLAGTTMTFYYAIVSGDETGIAFNDGNFYRGVKEQLTQGQTINNDQNLVYSTRDRNVYEAAYDDALILVIKDNDIYNSITSLVLNDKKITDLKGLEEFIGLKSNLNVSYNYITSINRIIELENNKENKEEELSAKFKKALEDLRAVVAVYNDARTQYKAGVEDRGKAEQIYLNAQREYELAETVADKEGKKSEMDTALKNYQAASTNVDNLLEAMERAYNAMFESERKVYNTYEKIYKTISLLPVDINYLSYEDLSKGNKETLAQYSQEIMTRVSNLEKNNGLTSFEKDNIGNLLQQWGATVGIEYKTESAVEIPGSTTEEGTTTSTQPIEYPISEFFTKVAGTDATLNVTDYGEFVYMFKCLDALSQIEQYTRIRRLFEIQELPEMEPELAELSRAELKKVEGYSFDYSDAALAEIKEEYDYLGNDFYFYGLIDKTDNDTYQSSSKYGNIDINITLDLNEAGESTEDPEGEAPADGETPVEDEEHEGEQVKDETDAVDRFNSSYVLILAERLNAIDDSELSTYIYLPRLRKLNIADNKTRNLKGIEALNELEELNAWKNMVDDISNVDWSGLDNLTSLNLGYNQISDIKPLEVLTKLINLNVSYNLLEGKFTFKLINMKNLKIADFSHNQYNDISYANDQFILKAMGYDANGDGIAEGYTVPEYLKAANVILSFQYQTLEMNTTIVKTDDEFVEFDLPLIFRQFESMDNERTSFGVDSVGGLVEPEGKTVKLRVGDVGKHKAIVTVEGANGYMYSERYMPLPPKKANVDETVFNDFAASSFDGSYYGYTTSGIGYGTICIINYNVVENAVVPDDPTTPDNPNNPNNPNNPTDPTTPDNPDNPTDPTTPDTPTDSDKPEYGYPVSNGFVYVYYPETSLADFAKSLVDLSKYDVQITENKTNNIGTSSVVTIVDKNDNNKVYDIFEVVVKGDINGDGSVDALDSGLVRAVINDTAALNGSFGAAADVNSDGTIDSLDSMMILKYRADRIANFED